MIDFLMWGHWWLRWVASAVVRVTTDLRHTDSRGLLHDQSSGRRHLGQPTVEGQSSPRLVPMGNAIINMYITGVDKDLRERRGSSQSLHSVCSIMPHFANRYRPPESVRRGMGCCAELSRCSKLCLA